jgi:hypothetical protein
LISATFSGSSGSEIVRVEIELGGEIPVVDKAGVRKGVVGFDVETSELRTPSGKENVGGVPRSRVDRRGCSEDRFRSNIKAYSKYVKYSLRWSPEM